MKERCGAPLLGLAKSMYDILTVLKRYVLIKDLKGLIQVQSLMYLGTSFHSFGALALKDLSHKVDSDLSLGGTSNKLSFERKLYLVASCGYLFIFKHL